MSAVDLDGRTAELRWLATYRLPGPRPVAPIAPAWSFVDDPSAWNAVWSVVRRHRIVGLLHTAYLDGAVALAEDQAAQLTSTHLDWCISMLGLERRLLEVVDAFERAGLELIVLKGTAVAHLDYPDPAMRMFGDNDVLVHPDQVQPALELLGDLGYHRPKAGASADFDRRFGKGATLRGPLGDELDVHRNLLFGTFGFALDIDELCASTTTFALGGRELPALTVEMRLLHSCYHAALGDPDPRLNALRDIAQQARSDAYDPALVRDIAERWQATAVLVRGLGLVRELLGVRDLGALSHVSERYPSRAYERRAVASYVGANRSFAAKVRASLPFLPWRERARFLRWVLLPSKEFVTTRGSRPGWPWMRRGLRSLRKGSR